MSSQYIYINHIKTSYPLQNLTGKSINHARPYPHHHIYHTGKEGVKTVMFSPLPFRFARRKKNDNWLKLLGGGDVERRVDVCGDGPNLGTQLLLNPVCV